MKHSFLHSLVMGAIVLCSVATVITSCKKEEPSLANEWYFGKWYMELNKKGTLGTDSIRYEYTKVVLCGDFGEKHEGFWSLIYVDSANHAISPNGESYWANCQYMVQDKTVRLNLNPSYLPMAQKEWTLTYDGDCLETMYENQLVDLHRIKTQEYEQYQIWMRELGFGFSEDQIENYNINDKDITATNWRDQAGLYIYDGKGTDVKDEKGRTGYTAVYFPWYKGDVISTNLDPEFCDDITPENGWEWVLNLCGDRTIPNNNFFALYNKYSGILRIFYYMPNNVTSGTDHMWEIDMTNMMAQRSVWGYGLPMDLKITNKAAIGQDKANFFVDYITPYVRQAAPDGKITPNQGWWAFDIDMSLYRPDDYSFADNQSMSLQMRSWDEEHISLTSAITGKLDGDMKLDQTKTRTIVSKKKGLFGFINDGIKLGKTAASAIASAKKGDIKGALKNGISTAKDGYALYGALKNNKNSSTTVTDTLSRISGSFNASVQADAETEGIIQSSKPVMGAASPTIPGKKFIKAGTGVGDGVWNLKTSPVVYYFHHGMFHFSTGVRDGTYIIYFFDPSSVDVVLNPDVFPESEVEWAEVSALCGVRNETNNGSIKKYRSAYGLDYKLSLDYYSKDRTTWPHFQNISQNYYWPFDFLYNEDDKLDMTYSHHVKFGNQKISGRGLTSEYYIEPAVNTDFSQLEVSVTVLVKLRSQDAPIVLQRTYLPAIKRIDIYSETQFAAIYDQIVSKPKKDGKIEMGSLYDYQLKRIHSFRRYLDDEFEFKAVSFSGGTFDAKGLIASYDQYWTTQNTQTGNWSFEWAYDKPNMPWAYEIVNFNDREYSPISWKLLGKLNEGDEWTLLDEKIDNKAWLPRTPWGQYAKYDLIVKNQPWQYYRLEITKKYAKSDRLCIRRFKLLY